MPGARLTMRVALVLALVSGPALAQATKPKQAELPRLSVDVRTPDTTGYTQVYVGDTGDPVRNGASLKSAIERASCSPNGTVISIDHRAAYQRAGNFQLPAKECAPGQWVIIQTDAVGQLPPPGTRVTLSHLNLMPVIRDVTVNVPGIQVMPSARRYRLIGIRVETPDRGAFNTSESLVVMGDGGPDLQTSREQIPDSIVLDRVILRGNTALRHEVVGGAEFQCQNCALVDSHIDQIHRVGFEAQGIRGWNSNGPWLIQNNYIEAAAMCILIGGADPRVANAVPADITFRRNHCFKPLTWNRRDPSYAGVRWAVKNHIELKLGVRVLIEGNVLENTWPDAQAGSALLFNTSNANNRSPWSEVADVTFRLNRVERAAGGPIEIGSTNGVYASRVTKRITVQNNLFTNQGGSSGRYFLWGQSRKTIVPGDEGGFADFIVQHNTLIVSSSFPRVSATVAIDADWPAGQKPFATAGGGVGSGFAVHDNIFAAGRSPSEGSGVNESCKVDGQPRGGFGCYSAKSWYRNLVYFSAPFGTWCRAGSDFSPWAENRAACVSALADVGFVDFEKGDFRLTPKSKGYKAATDGTDVGANVGAPGAGLAGTVFGETCGAVNGEWSCFKPLAASTKAP